MKKLALLLALLIACLNFAACERKCQCVTVPTPDQDYIHNCDEPTDTSSLPETTEEETPDIEIAPDGYIDISVKDFGGATYEGEDKISLIKDHSQLMKFYELNGMAITDAYEEDFFEEKALAIVLVTRGSGSVMLDIKHTRIKDGILQVTLTNRTPECGTDDMQYRAFAIEIAQKAIEGITEAELITERVGVEYIWEDSDIYIDEEFQLYRYDGILEKNEKFCMFGNCGWLEIITDEYELLQVLDRYTPTADCIENLETFANGLEDNFFEEKAIIAIPHYSDVKHTEYYSSYYALTNIGSMDDGIALYFYGNDYNVTADGLQLAVISKDKLPINNRYNVFFMDTREEIVDLSHCELTEVSE